MCVRSASTGLCGGQRVTAVPTATQVIHSDDALLVPEIAALEIIAISRISARWIELERGRYDLAGETACPTKARAAGLGLRFGSVAEPAPEAQR